MDTRASEALCCVASVRVPQESLGKFRLAGHTRATPSTAVTGDFTLLKVS